MRYLREKLESRKSNVITIHNDLKEVTVFKKYLPSSEVKMKKSIHLS